MALFNQTGDTEVSELGGMLSGWAVAIKDTALHSSFTSHSYAAFATALDAAAAAIRQVSTAKATVSLILTEPTGSRADKLTLARDVVNRAASAATRSLVALRAASETLRRELGAAFLPGKPSGVDNATLMDVKADLIRVLDAGGDVLPTAVSLLQDALARHDAEGQLRAYVLAGGPLELYYQAKGVNAQQAEQQFREAFAAASPTGAISDTVDLRALVGTGANTLAGFLGGAPAIIYQDQQRLLDYINKAAITVQNTPQVPLSALLLANMARQGHA